MEFLKVPPIFILILVIVIIWYVIPKGEFYKFDKAKMDKEKMEKINREILDKEKMEKQNKVILDKQIDDVKKLISETEKKLEDAKKQKQEILLSYDREITAAQNDEIVSVAENDEMKECPECAEHVRARAKICRYCGYRFDAV